MRYVAALTVLALVAFGAVACEDSPTSPTSTDDDISVTNQTDVDIDIDVSVNDDHSDLGPTPTRNSDPNPPVSTGTVPNRSSFTDNLAATSASFATACEAGPGGFDYIKEVVEGLNAEDTRWGYAGKSGSPTDISKDTVTYNLSDTFISGDTSEVEAVDVVLQCGTDTQAAGWNPLPSGHGAAYVYPFPG